MIFKIQVADKNVMLISQAGHCILQFLEDPRSVLLPVGRTNNLEYFCKDCIVQVYKTKTSVCAVVFPLEQSDEDASY